MADIDINPFGGDDRTESRTDETGENIPLSPVTPGGRSTWEPGQSHTSAEREQEMSFRGESQRTKLMKNYIKDLYKKLSETLVKPQKNFTMIISNSKMGNCTTEVRESP